MRGWAMKTWQILILALVGIVVAIIYMIRPETHNFRYRLTVYIDVNGTPKSASSILEAHYLMGSDGNGLRWHTTVMGVVPLFELGKDGTLLPALDYHVGDLQSRNGGGALNPIPFDGGGFPLGAYRQETPKHIERMHGVAELDPKYYPIFVWIPPSGEWREARQMYYNEIAERATPSIRIIKITVQPAWRETIKTMIEGDAPWVAKARDDKSYGQPSVFKLRRDMFEHWQHF